MYHLKPHLPYNILARNKHAGGNEVIEMAQYDYIRFLFFNEGLSKREISRRVNVHRNTVTRAIENNMNTYTLSVEKESPINGPFEEKISLMVQENYSKPRKHKLTKTRMYELMCDEGYTGSYSAFTYQVRKIEEEFSLSTKEAFLKLEHPNGVMQVDFGEMIVMEKGVPRKIYVFCSKLSSEKAEFVQAYPRQSTEFFFDGLNKAFDFFGGVPKKIIFDNLKQAVKEVKEGTERILQEEFLKFKAFYAFEAEFCGPGKGNEKGLVENLVKYTRNNYFLPYPDFKGFHHLNEKLLTKCWNRMQSKRTEGLTWQEMLLRSRENNFLPIREYYDCAKITTAKVDTYQLAHVDRNRYSVPTAFVGKKVDLKIYPFKIIISYKNTVIAEHERLFAKNKDSLNPYHFLDLLMKKSRAYDDALVIKNWHLPEIFEVYHQKLKAFTQSVPKGTKEFISILKLTQTYGVERIRKILKDLDAENRYSYEEVLSILRYQEDLPKKIILNANTLETLGVGHIKSSHMPLAAYDALTKGGEDIEQRIS